MHVAGFQVIVVYMTETGRIHEYYWCVNREIKSYQAAFLPLVEELRRGYRHGHPVRDSSRSEDDFRDFLMRVILLFCIGDYPGQAKLCNMKHAGTSGHTLCTHCTHIVHYS